MGMKILLAQEGTRAWRIRAFGALCIFAIMPLAILTIVTLLKVSSSFYTILFSSIFSRKRPLKKAKLNCPAESQIWRQKLRSWRNEVPTVVSSKKSDTSLILH